MLLKKHKIQEREYQKNIAEVAKKKNTLVILPTGLGKTVIALFVMEHFLRDKKNGKVLFVAPTKPLVMQHRKSILEFLNIDKDDITIVSGEKPKKKRLLDYEKKVVVATPQTIRNDLRNIDINSFSLIVFDEAHRAVGNYAYVSIAKNFRGRILGLTASPGYTEEHIEEVTKNLKIKSVEIRRKEDTDVKKYVQEIGVRWVRVSLPDEMRKIVSLLERFILRVSEEIRKEGIVKKARLNRFDAVMLQKRYSSVVRRNPSRKAFRILFLVAALMKTYHALSLIETQGIRAFQNYIEKMRKKEKKAKSEIMIVNSEEFREILSYLKEEKINKIEHPKVDVLLNTIKERLERDSKSRIIVFAHYRESVVFLEKYLKRKGIKVKRFIGQASKEGIKGLSQKQQKEIIELFKRGKYRVLIATSVGEEGIDIPEVNLVVFYEPVPSDIRTIQRRGRTGRKFRGDVVILITRDTLDERSYYSARHKEKKMGEILTKVKKKIEREAKQKKLFEY